MHYVHGARRNVSPEIAVARTAAERCLAALPEAYDGATPSMRPAKPLERRLHATTRRLADGAMRCSTGASSGGFGITKATPRPRPPAPRSAAAATRARDRRCVRDRPPEARVEASEDDLLVRRRAARSY